MLLVTDANLLLGRLRVQDFPAIFGPDQNQRLDVHATHKAFDELTNDINVFLQHQAEDEGATRKVMTKYEVRKSAIYTPGKSFARWLWAFCRLQTKLCVVRFGP